MNTKSKLQLQFEEETKTPSVNSQKEFDIDYVYWLEKQIFSLNPEEHEIPEGQIVLIKRSIEKDGLPKEKGLYVVIYKDMPLGCLFSKEKKSWVSGDYRVDKAITHWYEEITLPIQPVKEGEPTYEELKDLFDNLSIDEDPKDYSKKCVQYSVATEEKIIQLIEKYRK